MDDLLKEISSEIKLLKLLNKKQSDMIVRRDVLLDKILKDTEGAQKGTVLESVRRKILAHNKKVELSGRYLK
jgi:hypothetical protein